MRTVNHALVQCAIDAGAKKISGVQIYRNRHGERTHRVRNYERVPDKFCVPAEKVKQ